MRALVCFLALFSSLVAHADLNVSLATITPGSTLDSAFGHTEVWIKDTETPDLIAVYSYGGVDLRKMFAPPYSDIVNSFLKILKSEVPAEATKRVVGIDKDTGLPLTTKKTYIDNKSSRREVIINTIELTQSQAAALKSLLDEDTTPGKNKYSYNNFTNNCATKPRDRLLHDILKIDGSDAMKAPLETSIQTITMDSIDEATKLSLTKSVALFRRDAGISSMQLTMVKALLGLETLEFSDTNGKKSSENFFEALKTSEAYLSESEQLTQIAGEERAAQIVEAFHIYFFNPENTKNPIEKYQSLFTPRNLRAALLEIENPEVPGTKLIKCTASEEKPGVCAEDIRHISVPLE